MLKVLVIGAGGAGKTTFARALAERTGLPLIHLDTLYWSAGWTPTPNEEWDRTIERLIAGDEWIMDGNYGRTLPMRLAACDTVIFLDMPRVQSLWRVVRRSIRYRGRSRPDLPAGCPDQVTWEYIWWIWTYKKRRRPDIMRRLSAVPPGVRVVVLSSARKAREFLDRPE